MTDHIDRSRFDVHSAASTNFFAIRKLIQETKPDTVLLMSSLAGAMGTLAAIGSGARVVYRIGGWSFNDPIASHRWMRYPERLLSRWRDVVIVNNKHDYDQALRLRIVPPEKIKLIHNGIDPFKLKLLPRDEARAKLSLPQDGLIVGTIARRDPTKGLEYLPKDVVIVHDIPDASQYLLAFDVFVSSSVKEGFSWTILEAMAAKVPVIATRVGAAPEMIEDGVSGFLVPPRDTKMLTERMKTLLGNDRMRQEFAIRAHQKVLQSFDIQTMLREVSKVL